MSTKRDGGPADPAPAHHDVGCETVKSREFLHRTTAATLRFLAPYTYASVGWRAMADLSLKDVLDATLSAVDSLRADLTKEIRAVDAKVDAVRADLTKEIRAVDAKVDSVRTDLMKEIRAVDAKVDALDAKVDAVDAKVDSVRTDLMKEIRAVDAKVDANRAEIAAHRKETAAGFKEVNEHFDSHITAVHRDLEDDIAVIHKGLVRAKVPGIPKDLPSQVRAKKARPSKPAKRTARKR